MKLKVWKEALPQDDSPDQLYIRMEACNEHEDIHFFVCDKTGKEIDSGNLFTIDLNLKAIVLHLDVTERAGLKTDIEGALIVATVKELEISHEHRAKKHFSRMIHAGIAKAHEEQAQESSSKH